jgi:hypothetical protein
MLIFEEDETEYSKIEDLSYIILPEEDLFEVELYICRIL